MKFIYLFFSSVKHFRTYLRVKIFQKRFFILNKTGKHFKALRSEDKLLVVIAHVVPGAANAPAEKLERLLQCLNSLGISLNAFDYKIILLSKENFSLHDQLPEYWKSKTEIYYSEQADPMFVEYDAYDLFVKYLNAYDYFLFLEDDLLLTDSWFLEKIKRFNYYSPYKQYVLTPHRFEYYNGVKHYFDQYIVSDTGATSYKYSDSLKINLDDAAFTIFENPHSAFYCLSKEQLELWIRSGYKWKNKVVAFGVLESAATFSLYENFEFFKPHPDNIGYFEVQHFGNKYISYHNTCKKQDQTF